MVLPASALAGVPDMIGFQGFLTDVNGNAVEAAAGLKMTFKLYHDPQGGADFWNDTFDKVQIEHGIFFVVLGAGQNPLPLLDGSVKYLGMSVTDGPELEPRMQFISVPYALRSDTAGTADLAQDAVKLGGVDASQYVKSAEFGTTGTDVAVLKQKVSELDAQIKVLLSQGSSNCSNDCSPGESGCSEDFGQSYTCGEAKDGDSCFEKISEACSGQKKCVAGVCQCAAAWQNVCISDSAYEQDSCGKTGKLIAKCTEGRCQAGACVTWKRETQLVISGMNSVFTLSGHLYAAGNNGVVVHYNGSEWTQMATGTTKSLRGIWGYDEAGSAVLYAVGDSGKILQYKAGKWATIYTGSYANLNAIFGLSSTNVIAVGDNGAVLRWNGTKWKAEVWDSGAAWKTTNFQSVWAYSASKLWVGGDSGTIIFNDGTQWGQQATPGGTGAIHGIWGVSDQNVWGATDGKIIRFTNDWKDEGLSDGASVNFKAIVGASSGGSTFIFAVGDGGNVYKNDSFSWSKQEKVSQVLGGGANFRGVWGGASAPAGGIWAVAGDGRMAYVDPDGKWNFPSLTRTIAGIYGEGGGPEDQWAVGSDCLALRKVGSQWVEVPIVDGQCQGGAGGADFKAIWGDPSGNTLMAVGESGLFKSWDGGSWIDMVGPNGNTNEDVWGTGPNDLLVVQQGGTILWNGAIWQPTGGGYGTRGFGTSTKSFHVIDGSSGSVQSFDGSEWVTRSVAGSALRDIWGTGANDVWVVGQKGAVYQYNGSDWVDRSIPEDILGYGGETLNGIWLSNLSPIYVAATSGFTYRSDGGKWSVQQTSPATDHTVVFGIDSSNVLLGGVASIYRRD